MPPIQHAYYKLKRFDNLIPFANIVIFEFVLYYTPNKLHYKFNLLSKQFIESTNLSLLRLSIRWTLKFKIQTTITLFIAVNHYRGPLRKQKHLAQWGQKVIFMNFDWRISFHFVGFLIFFQSTGCHCNYD